MGGTYRNQKERNVLGNLPRGWPYLKPIPKIPSKQPFRYVKGFGEDELNGSHETLSDQEKQPQPKRQKQINVIKC
jgi:hypothetical protein